MRSPTLRFAPPSPSGCLYDDAPKARQRLLGAAHLRRFGWALPRTGTVQIVSNPRLAVQWAAPTKTPLPLRSMPLRGIKTPPSQNSR